MTTTEGSVTTSIKDSIGTIFFSHPKGNSLPAPLLKSFVESIQKLGEDPNVNVIVLKSEGVSTFCSGASFDELKAVKTAKEGMEFFSGISKVILALKSANKFTLGRIQGKAVGGGVGIVAACDYVLAHESASLKLSELALGLGPFLIGPAIERKIGSAQFSYMSIDADWRDAAWAKSTGFYTEVYPTHEELDLAIDAMALKLSKFSPEAMKELKRVLWEGTENWDKLLFDRAAISGRLVQTEFCKKMIASAAAK